MPLAQRWRHWHPRPFGERVGVRGGGGATALALTPTLSQREREKGDLGEREREREKGGQGEREFMRRRALLHAAWAWPLTASFAHAQSPANAPLRVVTSFSILANITSEISGSLAEVTSLVGAGIDAHVYQPSPADAQRLAKADLIVINGLGFEGWIPRLIAASGARAPVVVASEGIAPRMLAGRPDPHAWQSLVHARRYVENIRAGLAAARPAQAAEFARRAASYLGRIDTLDAAARARFARIAPDQRRVISSHDAFGYLGDAYGIHFFAPQGRSTETEASAADMARVITQIRAQRIRAVFVENMGDRRLIDSVAREGRVGIGGTLYSDTLSPPGTAADTYLKLYAHNIESIAAALSSGVEQKP